MFITVFLETKTSNLKVLAPNAVTHLGPAVLHCTYLFSKCYACILPSWRPLSTSQSACGQSSTVLATVLDAHMMADARAATALASASYAVVLADARAATALA